MPSEKHKLEVPTRLNNDADKDGGLTHSSDETFVMKVKPRG